MGMVTVLRRIDDDTMKLLLKHPALIHAFLDEEGEESRPAKGFLSRLFGGSAATIPSLPPVERTLTMKSI